MLGQDPLEQSPQLSPEAIERHFRRVAGDDADAMLLDARAPNTWRDTAYRLSRYERWCAAAAHTPWPCPPLQLQGYVRFLIAERLAPASISAYIAAVMTGGRLRNAPVDATLCGEFLKAAKRRHGPPRRARPARGMDLKAIVALLDPTAPRDVRDGMVLLVGWALAARSSEICGLDWHKAGSALTGSTGVITLERDAIVVRWRKTKTAQSTETQLTIPDDDAPMVRNWLQRWLDISQVEPGTPLVRGLTKYETLRKARPSTALVTTIVRRRIVQLEVARGASRDDALRKSSAFSSHSLRRGFVTSAAENGVAFNHIRARSRHANDAELARYVGEVQDRSQSGLRGLLND